MEKKSEEPKDVFFDRVGMQLILPPTSSMKLLDSIAAGATPTTPSLSESLAIENTKSFLGWILRSEYKPPDETVFVVFSDEDGTFDIIRAQYKSGDMFFQIARTLSMASIAIIGSVPEPSCIVRAEKLANRIFNVRHPLEFDQLGISGDMFYGIKRREHMQESFWEDHLRMWCKGDKVGFLTLASVGYGSSAVLGPDEFLNKKWFLPSGPKCPK